jgi:hypothetical protein
LKKLQFGEKSISNIFGGFGKTLSKVTKTNIFSLCKNIYLLPILPIFDLSNSKGFYFCYVGLLQNSDSFLFRTFILCWSQYIFLTELLLNINKKKKIKQEKTKVLLNADLII